MYLIKSRYNLIKYRSVADLVGVRGAGERPRQTRNITGWLQSGHLTGWLPVYPCLTMSLWLVHIIIFIIIIIAVINAIIAVIIRVRIACFFLPRMKAIRSALLKASWLKTSSCWLLMFDIHPRPPPSPLISIISTLCFNLLGIMCTEWLSEMTNNCYTNLLLKTPDFRLHII